MAARRVEVRFAQEPGRHKLAEVVDRAILQPHSWQSSVKLRNLLVNQKTRETCPLSGGAASVGSVSKTHVGSPNCRRYDKSSAVRPSDKEKRASQPEGGPGTGAATRGDEVGALHPLRRPRSGAGDTPAALKSRPCI